MLLLKDAVFLPAGQERRFERDRSHERTKLPPAVISLNMPSSDGDHDDDCRARFVGYYTAHE